MKTLESVLKAISIESDKCEHCNAKEGVEHPLEGLKVELKALPGEEQFKKYCQICYIERSKKTQKEKKKDIWIYIPSVINKDSGQGTSRLYLTTLDSVDHPVIGGRSNEGLWWW